MEPKQRSNRRTIAIVVLVVLVLLAAILFFVAGRSKPEETTPKIGYAEGVTVVEDPDALQKAVDEMYANANNGITLEYHQAATSTDGENFSCYIANAVENNYDMYIQIFADAELTDQLFLSGLVRPGNAFQEITMEHPLDTGNHTVYVVFTQVEEDLETLHAQVTVTMEFCVDEA